MIGLSLGPFWLRSNRLGRNVRAYSSMTFDRGLTLTLFADSQTGKYALMKCTLWTFRWQFVAGIFPRLLAIGFTFSQPFLINAVIDFVAESAISSEEVPYANKRAAGLIGATLLLYVGLAISTAWYKHMTYQLMTMYRGSLASLVFKKTLTLQSSSIKDAAPVTLMSTDVERIVGAGASVHDIWASFMELPIAMYLLYRHVGPPSLFFLVPSFSK